MDEKPERLLSLDVFRGITLAGMVLVNSPGNRENTYPALLHVDWNGWKFADLILPFFVFIVGVAIPYSLDSLLARGASRKAIVLKIVRRSALLFAIGLAMNAVPHYDDAHDHILFFGLSDLRIFGALQRVALCYLFASLIYLGFRPKGQVVIGALLLVFYFVVMKFVPVPGYGAGVLEPIGNWAQYIDSHLMAGHLGWHSEAGDWEGKGLLSTLPAIATALIGVLTGQYLKSAAQPLEKTTNMYFFGVLGIFFGTLWSLCFPINQHLWTSSLVLLMGGIALLVLASCYYVCDVKKSTWWTLPLLVFGRNSLAVWVLSIVFQQMLGLICFRGSDGMTIDLKTRMYRWLADWAGPQNGSLLFAVGYVLFWLAVMGLLYRKRIFIKI
jgi:predicted acyltransferase